jgi:hypothetical protein
MLENSPFPGKRLMRLQNGAVGMNEKKQTPRTGKRIGATRSDKVCITIEDPERIVSNLWEEVKKHSSRRLEPAARTAYRVILKGLTAELAEILERIDAERQEQNNALQGDLFPEKDNYNEGKI